VAVGHKAQVASDPDITFVAARDVFKIYKEGLIETVALRGASLELARGRLTSLVGPSGSGKSTLISLLAGLALPSAGQIVIGGQDITRLDEGQRGRLRSQRIGLVFQSGNLIPFLTALENVELAMGLRDKPPSTGRARELLSEVGLGRRLQHRPGQLSGGEVQRVAVAVALANEPELLLADELTGELDSATAEQVMEVLAEAWRQRRLTVLLVTHNPELADRADQRLRLVDGLIQTS
jgi:putative ABC transport system ATP-binding protein